LFEPTQQAAIREKPSVSVSVLSNKFYYKSIEIKHKYTHSFITKSLNVTKQVSHVNQW